MEMVMFDEMDKDDESLIKKMIQDHSAFTGSDVAADLLKSWKNSFTQFVKVMPMDYKVVLEKRKAEKRVAVKV